RAAVARARATFPSRLARAAANNRSREASRAFEALTVLAPKTPTAVDGEQAIAPLRIARTCYDHLAGRLGVLVTEALVRRRFLLPAQREFRLTKSGEAFLRRLEVDVEQARHQRRA